MTALFQHFARSARTFADRTALVEGDQVWTYQNLLDSVEHLATEWRGSMGEGLRVGMPFQSTVSHIRAFLALLGTGAVPFLIDPSTETWLVDAIAADVGLDAVLDRDKPHSSPPMRLPTFERPPLFASTVLCRFTSGSGGAPKCLEFSPAAVAAAASAWAAGTHLSGSDQVLCVTPFSNGLAFNTSLLSVFDVGATLIVSSAALLTRRSLDDHLSQHGVTRLIGFPSFFRRMLISPRGRPAPRLRRIVSAAAEMEVDLRASLEASFGSPVFDYYGVAEVGPVTSGDGPHRPGAMGHLLPGAQARVVSRDGTDALAVKTGWMATRYLNAPDVFESRMYDGFFLTGDVGRVVDEQLFLSGRSDRTVKIGGRAVELPAIEVAARELPSVADAIASVVKPLGKEPVLLLAVATSDIDERGIRDALQSRLPAYMLPARIVICDELPRNALGKTIFPLEEQSHEH